VKVRALAPNVWRVDITKATVAELARWLDEPLRADHRVRQTEIPGIYIVWRRP